MGPSSGSRSRTLTQVAVEGEDDENVDAHKFGALLDEVIERAHDSPEEPGVAVQELRQEERNRAADKQVRQRQREDVQEQVLAPHL